jgi:hypothetical protein
METADKMVTNFLSTGDYEYIAKLQKIHTSLNKLIQEVIDAQQGETDIDTRLVDAIFEGENWAANLTANGFKVTGAADATGATDYTTLQQVNALISGGGSPGDIAITALGVGTGTANQKIVINGAGTAVVGADEISVAWTVITANTTVTNLSRTIADVSSGTFTLTLPSSPSVGDWVQINKDGSYALTIGRNGEPINGAAIDGTVQTDGSFTLMYMDASRGWVQ